MDKKTVSLLKKAMKQTIKINALGHELIKDNEKINLDYFFDTSDWQKFIAHYVFTKYDELNSISESIDGYVKKLNLFIRRECKYGNGSIELTLEDFTTYVYECSPTQNYKIWGEIKGIIEDIKKETEF